MTSPASPRTATGGYAATPGVDGDWDLNETLVYRVTVSIDDDPNAEGLNTARTPCAGRPATSKTRGARAPPVLT